MERDELHLLTVRQKPAQVREDITIGRLWKRGSGFSLFGCDLCMVVTSVVLGVTSFGVLRQGWDQFKKGERHKRDSSET